MKLGSRFYPASSLYEKILDLSGPERDEMLPTIVEKRIKLGEVLDYISLVSMLEDIEAKTTFCQRYYSDVDRRSFLPIYVFYGLVSLATKAYMPLF